jgi:cell division protein FtsQ
LLPAFFLLMARNQGPPSDDSFYRRGEASRRSFADDALTPDPRLDEDDDEEDRQQFRRASKRVPVRRGALPRRTASRVRNVLAVLLVLAALGGAAYELRGFALHAWRFRVRTDSIELTGDASASRAQVMEKLRESVGKNVFQVSLEERKRELEKIPWVEAASIIRIWPNHLRVTVKERTPVAFIALGERVELVDAYGVVMDLPQGRDYSFPVILGMSENEPLSTRAPRMKTFTRMMHELDDGGGSGAAKLQYSRNLDEVDLSDPEDVKVLAKGGSGPILLHLGNEDFLQRFMTFLSNVQKWEQERGKLKSVDLRYGHEVILNPDVRSAPPPPTVAKAAAPKEPAKAGKTKHEPQKKRK